MVEVALFRQDRGIHALARSRNILRLSLVFLPAMLAAGAAAHPPERIVTGTNTGRETSQTVYSIGDWGSPEVQPNAQALPIARQLARCVVARSPAGAKASLDAPDKDSFMSAAHRLNNTLADCFQVYGDIAIQPAVFAGLLSEAWFERSGAPAFAPMKYDPNTPKLDFMANGPASLAQLRLAECLANRHPGEVIRLISAKPGSPDEDTAFGAVIPLISSCLDRNVTLQLSRGSLRLPLAYALYRRTLDSAHEPRIANQRRPSDS